jgi:hypothetical protein
MRRATVLVHPKKKKKIGRPATGRDPAVTVRIPQETLDAVTRWAKQHDYNRSTAIVDLVERGLRTRGLK